MAEALAVPPRTRLFYGWVIVGVCLVVSMMAGSLLTVFGLFIIPMQEELGWSRATLVLPITISALLGGVVAPLIGPVIDRRGGRALLVAAALVGGAAIALSSQVHAPWQLYLLYGALGVTLIQNVTFQVTSVVVAKWFVAKRGRALGFANAGISLGSLFMIPLMGVVLNASGWRLGFAVLGGLMAGGIALPTALFLRRTPEDMGLLPDGAQPGVAQVGAAAAPAPPPRPEPVWTLGEALRTRALWLLVFAWLFATLPVIAYLLHAIPYLQGEKGLGDVAKAAWTTWFFFAFASKVVWGFLSERIPARISVVTCFLGEAVGMLLLLHVGQSAGMLFLFAVVGGLGHGPFAQLQTLIWADYYGRPFLGTIRGALAPPAVLAGAVGPLLAAYLFQQQGSYRTVWILFAALFLVAALLALLAAPPKRKEQAAGQPRPTPSVQPADT